MARSVQRLFPCWSFVFVAVITLTGGRLIRYKQTDSHTPSRTHHGNIQPHFSAQVTQEQSERLRPVRVRCHPDSLEVVVQADMFDTGLLVEGAHLRLGSQPVGEGSPCGAVPSGDTEFTLQAHLMDCGSELSSTVEKIIYSNVLVYSPEPSPEGVLRLEAATIPVECHYDKVSAVDGLSLQPAWVHFVSKTTADSQIDFHLRLMTDDWRFERGSYSYFLGDPIHFEASVVMAHHMPLRVYVDHCVATATPDTEATTRYDFIEYSGCLADAFLTNSSSRFLSRVEEHTLRFQLEAFRFHQEPDHQQVYIMCYLKAVPVTSPVSAQNRACSYIDKRWRSVDGHDQACRSCDKSHRFEEPRPTEQPKTTSKAKSWSAGTSGV
ncbi:zona pellucida sperm-binding protein 3-like, partial [Aulostomus maculatus]